jgi:hypothetical protein
LTISGYYAMMSSMIEAIPNPDPISGDTIARIRGLTGGQLPNAGNLFDKQSGVGIHVRDRGEDKGLYMSIATPQVAASRTPYYYYAGNLGLYMPDLEAAYKEKSLRGQTEDFIRALGGLGVPDIDKVGDAFMGNVDFQYRTDLRIPLANAYNDNRTLGFLYEIESTEVDKEPTLQFQLRYDTREGGYSLRDLPDSSRTQWEGQGHQLSENQGEQLAVLLERVIDSSQLIAKD